MSYQDLPVQMHVNYPDFVEFMKDCKLRQPPAALEVCFWVWYNARQENKKLKDELTRIKIAVDSFLNDGGAVGERGEACMSIDGSNL
jgi:hypothetical protein